MRVTYLGNFGAEHSTENHVARAFEANGHTVNRLQENDRAWERVPLLEHDMVLWTTTYDYAPPETFDAQREMLKRLEVPSVGFHLDRWWGLRREHRLHESPFFRCDLVITADGGHEQQFADAGIAHAWLPPGVSAPECALGARIDDLVAPLAFVGSWQGGYHQEWYHRAQLIEHLKQRGGRFYPPPGQPSVRGAALRNVYASTDVLVGDSCLAGGATHYISDRVPETIGRGGFLIHPRVEGVTDGTQYTEGDHLLCWSLGDWDELDNMIDAALSDPDMRRQVATAGREHVLAHHTYEVRAKQIVALMYQRGLL